MSRAAITVNRPLEAVQRLWEQSADRPQAEARFAEAPGDRGTEIHLTVPEGMKLEQAKDVLRRFKQVTETGELARSEGSPRGSDVAQGLKQRPAQPLSESEREEVGV